VCIVMSEREGEEVMVVWELGRGSHEGNGFKIPPYGARVLASFIVLAHHIVFMLNKVMVEMDVMGPNPPPNWDTDLITIGDMVSNGAVIDFEACQRFDAFLGM